MTVTERPPARGARPRVDIDPRLRARRVEVRRAEGRKRLRRLVVCLVVIGVSILAVGLTRTPLFDVDHVEVTGTSHTPADVVMASSGIEPGDAMTDIDLGAARQRVGALPWVESVDVRRRWPGTVIIAVHERVAVAVAAGPTGQWLTVDRAARVVEVTALPAPGLPRLTDGVFAATAAGVVLDGDLAGLLALAAALPDPVRPAISVVRTRDGSLELGLAAGGRVVLGSGDDLDAKLLAVAAVLDHLDQRCVSVLDVRVPGTPVLTRTSNCANVSTATGG